MTVNGPTNLEAFVAGYHAALRTVELQDMERTRMGRALTDDEVRRCAEHWANPIRWVTHDDTVQE